MKNPKPKKPLLVARSITRYVQRVTRPNGQQAGRAHNENYSLAKKKRILTNHTQ